MLKCKLIVLAVATMIGFSSLTAQAAQEASTQPYLSAVMTIMRTHIQAMHDLVNDGGKYADNVVLHANAIRSTLGFLDHPEWDAASWGKSLGPKAAIDGNALGAMAKQGQKASEELIQAARTWVKDQKRDEMLGALNNMAGTCNGCHLQLGREALPHVEVTASK